MRIIAKSAIAAAGLSVSLAAATAAAETASEAGATPLLEEMVVTAARREQNLGDVAQTVQALLGEELLDVGVTNLEEAIQLIPSAVYNSTIGPGSTTFSIRGVAGAMPGSRRSRRGVRQAWAVGSPT